MDMNYYYLTQKYQRRDALLQNALSYIFDSVGGDEEEYLEVCKNFIRMNQDELNEERINMGLDIEE